MAQIEEALKKAGIEILQYKETGVKSVITADGPMTPKKLGELLRERLGISMIEFPDVFKASHDPIALREMVKGIAGERGMDAADQGWSEEMVPDEYRDLTLNVNVMAIKREDAFFLTTPQGYISRLCSGFIYLRRSRMPDVVAFERAEEGIPRYMPRHRAGSHAEWDEQEGKFLPYFNSYIAPEWIQWKEKNPEEWRALPRSAPKKVQSLLKHLIPSREERNYLYAWLYASLFQRRSYVYLILCGAPGAGKNRLKLLMRALHGAENTADGKRSTLTERFNSQLQNKTLVWFDELKYDADMENTMKEIQNDYFSIEKKGVDATGSSEIYSSLVISNNKMRDNFIAFDARKFAPIEIAPTDLQNSMSTAEIDEMSRKLEIGKSEFDVKYVAQIAKWIMRIGKEYYEKNPTLVYRGPMFWALAHTSMTRWQKRAVSLITEKHYAATSSWVEEEKGYKWSSIEEKYAKRKEDTVTTFPDYSSVMAFFDIFRDSTGAKAFETRLLPGTNILRDFYIIPLIEDFNIVVEETTAQQRERGRLNGAKEKDPEEYDL